MDSWLASMYGTNSGIVTPTEEIDVERMAQAQLLQKVAEANDIDLDAMTDEQVGAFADQVGLDMGSGEGGGESGGESGGEGGDIETHSFQDDEGNAYSVAFDDGGVGHLQGQDGNWYPASAFGLDVPAPQQGVQKEAQARFDEADFLGRVMAHSFNQELGAIQKTAAGGKEIAQGIKQVAKSMGQIGASKRVGSTAWMGAKGKRALTAVGNVGKRTGELLAGGAKGGTPGFAGYTGRPGNPSRLLGAMKAGGKRKAEALKSLAARGVAVGTVGGGAALALGHKKESSVQADLLENMAFDRAINFLSQFDFSAHGLNFEPQGEVKVASPVVNQYVDQRAIEMMQAEGFNVQALLAQLK